MFKTIQVHEEDKERIKRLKEKLGKKEYEVIKMLLNYYERLETVCHYLNTTPEHFFYIVSERIKELWRYSVHLKLEDLKKLVKDISWFDNILTPKEAELIENIIANSLDRLYGKLKKEVDSDG